MSRGRPPTVKNFLIIEAILKYKDQVVYKSESGDDALVSETNSVWMLISKELDNKIKPASIYSYVVNDRFGVRKLLVHEISNGKSSDSENPDSERSESSFNSKNKSNIIFSLTFRKTEFEDLIMETTRQYKDKKGVSRTRIVNILHPKKWTEIMARKIYDDFRLHHGYHFESSYLSKDKGSGRFTGNKLRVYTNNTQVL